MLNFITDNFKTTSSKLRKLNKRLNNRVYMVLGKGAQGAYILYIEKTRGGVIYLKNIRITIVNYNVTLSIFLISTSELLSRIASKDTEIP